MHDSSDIEAYQWSLRGRPQEMHHWFLMMLQHDVLHNVSAARHGKKTRNKISKQKRKEKIFIKQPNAPYCLRENYECFYNLMGWLWNHRHSFSTNSGEEEGMQTDGFWINVSPNCFFRIAFRIPGVGRMPRAGLTTERRRSGISPLPPTVDFVWPP